jgi:hypothetical protein
MKKIIKLSDYLAHIDEATKTAIDAELSISEMLPEDLVIKRVALDNTTIEEFSEEEAVSGGYASTRTVDFSGDVVIPEGVNLDIFKLNPVIFYNHFSSNLPIGKATETFPDGFGVRIRIKYAVNESSEAETIYKLVKGGFIKQHSIGFLPLQTLKRGGDGFEQLNRELQDRYPEYDGSAARIITKSLLLEVSIVNIADNQASTIFEVKDFGAKDAENMKKFGLDLGEKDEKTDEKEPENTEIDTKKDEKDEKEPEIEEKEEKAEKCDVCGKEPCECTQDEEVEEPQIEIKRLPPKLPKINLYKSADQVTREKLAELAKQGKIVRLKDVK